MGASLPALLSEDGLESFFASLLDDVLVTADGVAAPDPLAEFDVLVDGGGAVGAATAGLIRGAGRAGGFLDTSGTLTTCV